MSRQVGENEVRALPGFSEEERADRLVDLARRVAGGESDRVVVSLLVQIAKDDNGWPSRNAWLSYISASRSPEFIPILEEWLVDSDENSRLDILAAVAFIVTPRTNSMLLNLVQTDQSLSVRRNALRQLVRRASLGEWEPVDLLALTQESDWRPVTKREYLKLVDTRREGPIR